MTHVFISYAREDREGAGRLAGALEACGWSVWWDPRIKAGQTFDDVIERELEKASSVVVLWSKHSIASEWVKNEASAAAERGVLIPARIDDVKVPLEFRRRQTADLVGWNGDPSHAGFRALGDAIAATVGSPAATSPAGKAARAEPVFPGRRRRLASGIAVTALVSALGGYVGWRMYPSGGSARPHEAAASPATPADAARESQDPPAPSGDGATALHPATPGIFEFRWPGGDCWKIYRGDIVATSSCGSGRHALQAGTYVVKPSSSAPFLPFSVSVKPGATTTADAGGGIFEFKWPGGDCWKVYRGDIVATGSCGSGRHALQAGTYLVKPSSSAVFAPFSVSVKPGATTSTDAMGGLFQFNWPGNDCWKAYRGDVEAKSSCGGGKHALQDGVYVVKPSSSQVFAPFSVRVLRGQTASAP